VTDTTAVLRGQDSPLTAVTAYFDYGKTTAYGSKTVSVSINLLGTVNVQMSVSGLQPGTTYHYRFVVQDLLGKTYGGDKSFTTTTIPTPPPPPVPAVTPVTVVGGAPVTSPVSVGGAATPGVGTTTPTTGDASTPGAVTPDPKPELGRKVVVASSGGTILVKSPGSDHFAAVDGSSPLAVGSIVDARKGTARLVTALGDGSTQAAAFRGSLFQVTQKAAGGGLTDIALRGGNFGVCRKGAAKAGAAHAARKARVVRRLWATDHNGRFRTHGRNSVATVRGTSWVTTDRCDGTLTRVFAGSVMVSDTAKHKNVLVSAGHSYLARSKR
jgi:hypothetical protein